jgi:predicted flap endonuclease-1-like 5' DNA nuclease
MGAALREAWLWVLLAFLLGLTIGYFVRQQPVRVRATSGGADATRSAAYDAHEDGFGKISPATSIPATAKGADVSLAALAASVPATVVEPVERSIEKVQATTKPAYRKPSAQAAVLDLAAARATLGVTVRLDDLKLIEGIGPKIETLFKADGITSWQELSKANVERLQGVLDAAGPRYKVQDPASWPRQAGLLAKGKWADFKALTDKLKDGR